MTGVVHRIGDAYRMWCPTAERYDTPPMDRAAMVARLGESHGQPEAVRELIAADAERRVARADAAGSSDTVAAPSNAAGEAGPMGTDARNFEAGGFVEMPRDYPLRDGPTLPAGIIGMVCGEESHGHYRVRWRGMVVSTIIPGEELRPSTREAYDASTLTAAPGRASP